MATILTKRSNTASSVPVAGDLTNSTGGAELAVNTADKRLFTKDSGGTVVELGTNPSSVTLPNGTANGVPYLNGSKVLTSGSALTFNGSNLGVTGNVTQTSGNFFTDTTSGYFFAGSGAFTGGIYGSNSGNYANIKAPTDIVSIIGSAEQMRLTSTGLGIGTSSPQASAKLHVYAAGDYTDESAPFTLGSSSTGDMRLYAGVNNTSDYTYIGSVRSGQAYGSLVLQPNGGNLGLGVTPSAWSGIKAMQTGTAASFSGGSGFNDAFIASNAFYDGANWKYINTNPAYYTSIGGSAAARWYTAPSGTAGNAISFTQAMTLNASGNWLLGTTTDGPFGRNAVLDGSGSAGVILRVGGAGTGFVYSDATNAYFGSNAGAVIFKPADTERARIDSSGSLLVGITTQIRSGDRLSVTGTGAQVITVRNDTDASGYSTYSSILQASGNNTSTYHLWGNTNAVGNWYLYGNGTTSFSSDARLKKNIETARNGYAEDLCKLRVVKYNWRNDEDGKPRELGLIAQEVEQVFPGLVQDDLNPVEAGGEIYKQIKQSVLPFMLLKAIQEQQAIIEQLKARLDAANL